MKREGSHTRECRGWRGVPGGMTPLRTATAVEIDDGVLIPSAEQGHRDGVPLVLLHGLTDSHRSYEPVLAALPDSIRAIALTARGHGDAGKPVSGYDQPRMAAAVRAQHPGAIRPRPRAMQET